MIQASKDATETIISKVFSDFKKTTSMNGKMIIPIIAGIVIVIGIAAFLIGNNSESMKAEDTPDKVQPQENISPEIQQKLDDIEKNNLENTYTPKEREWISSGPFQIDRSEYILGEKIFLRIGGLSMEEKGQVVFLRPSNETHYSVYQTIPFDGANKPAFNYYIEPDLSRNTNICSTDDIVGDWRVEFRGTDYPTLEFKVTDQILPGDEELYEPVC